MKQRRSSPTAKTKLYAAKSKSNIAREINTIKVAKKRKAIASNLRNAARSKTLKLTALGRDGTALSALNLKEVGDRNKRRILGKLVGAASRKR